MRARIGAAAAAAWLWLAPGCGQAPPAGVVRCCLQAYHPPAVAAASSPPAERPGADPASPERPSVTWALGEPLPPWQCYVSIGADEPQPVEPSAGQEPDATAPAPTTQPAAGKGYVEWRQRRGPAYPDDFWTSFGRDAKEMPATLWDDTKASFTNPWSLAGLALAGASGIALAASNADDEVAGHYTRHGSQLNTFWDSVGDAGGNPGTHFAVAGAMYFASLAAKDTRNYEVSKTLLNALIINGLLTEGLKVAARTDSPNGDPLGWPSGHTSSTFCLATVLGEAYGPWVGVPLFAFAGFVGYERIDARNHDFSDVISGAFIGMAIGHAVMQNHKPRIFGFEVVPLVNPAGGGAGVAMVKRF